MTTLASDTLIQKTIKYLDRSDLRIQLQDKIVDPILNHVLRRVFPYIILTCVFFVLLLLVVMLTLGIIIFQVRAQGAALAAAAALRQ